MADLFPDPPETSTPLPADDDSQAVRRFLARRRSAGKQCLAAPGPDAQQLAELLRVAARVPDHRRVEPWRFITIEGGAREAFGARLGDIAAANGEHSASAQALARDLPLRAPVVIVVVSSPDHAHKTPVWEQELSAGAVCYNLLLAARAAGFGAVWLTEWIAYDAAVAETLGLGASERIAGFIYIGTPTAEAPERPRPDMTAKVVRWTPV